MVLYRLLRKLPIGVPSRSFWSDTLSGLTGSDTDTPELTAAEARKLTSRELILTTSERRTYQSCLRGIKRNASKGLHHYINASPFWRPKDIVVEKLRRTGFDATLLVCKDDIFYEISWRNVAEKEVQEFNELIELEGSIDRLTN